MRVKLHENGYTKIYQDGTNKSINGDYLNDEELNDWIANGGVVEPFETQAEIDARIVEEENRKTINELEEIDIASIRSIREYLASLPDSPQFIKDKESQAVLTRNKLIK